VSISKEGPHASFERAEIAIARRSGSSFVLKHGVFIRNEAVTIVPISDHTKAKISVGL
jgi:hypothetical protein